MPAPTSIRVAHGPGAAWSPAPETLTRHGRFPLAPSNDDGAVTWGLASLVGRLGEISGTHAHASLTFAFRLVHEAQSRGEPVAWIHRPSSVFFPPDAAAAGIDLEALAVVRIPDLVHAARTADHLLRSGGFGLVVLDVGTDSRLPLPIQSRLAGLARRHDAALICLTEKDRHRASLGPLIGLRAEACRGRRLGDRFRCALQLLKDKGHGPGGSHVELCRGPEGCDGLTA